MSEMKLYVPTRKGEVLGVAAERDASTEFGEPYVPVIIREDDGVRVILGSHDYWDANTPNIRIERQDAGWTIFLHSRGESDQWRDACLIDGGYGFLLPAAPGRQIPTVVFRLGKVGPSKVTRPNELSIAEDHDVDEREECEFCGCRLELSSENWDGLCPRCADFVSTYLDQKGLTDADRDVAIEFLKADPREFIKRSDRT